MSIIPNMRFSPRVTIPENYPYSDVLFDYAQFLRDVDKAGSIAKNPDKSKSVVIIGGGASAICAAYELLRAGVTIAAIIEPDTTHVGRCYSARFPGNVQNLAELGSMRFPPSEVCLFNYIKKFNIPYTDNFPDPGKVDTLLRANGKSFTWKANGELPDQFKPLSDAWGAFLSNDLTLADGTKLIAPNTIASNLKKLNIEAAQPAWQAWITAFEPYSFRAAITLIFQQENINNIPNRVRWTDAQIELFGTLGVGSGGFGPLYSIGFVEILRLFVNELETDQQFIPGGIGSVFDAMKSADTGNGAVSQHIRGDRVVVNIYRKGDGKYSILTSSPGGGGGASITADAVIITSQTWASQVTFNLTDSASDSAVGSPIVFSPEVSTAIRNQHIIASSKSFMLTKDQFWKKNDVPANIQSDTFVRGLYCLEYSDNPDDPGVVLISYVWQDDSSKQIAPFQRAGSDDSAKEARTRRLVADVASFAPEFAKFLVPLNGDYENNTMFIDWTNEEYYRGAFKLNEPGQDIQTQAAFTQFMTAGTPDDTGVYLAGDCVSFYAGWVEGALQTGLNAACAVLKNFGATDFVEKNPLNGVKTLEYNYSTSPKKS